VRVVVNEATAEAITLTVVSPQQWSDLAVEIVATTPR
jgi:hypothetical protein